MSVCLKCWVQLIITTLYFKSLFKWKYCKCDPALADGLSELGAYLQDLVTKRHRCCFWAFHNK